jgi:hypothetical protein
MSSCTRINLKSPPVEERVVNVTKPITRIWYQYLITGRYRHQDTGSACGSVLRNVDLPGILEQMGMSGYFNVAI